MKKHGWIPYVTIYLFVTLGFIFLDINLSFPDTYTITTIDKVMSKLRYTKIISNEGLFYQGSDRVIPAIWTYNENSIDRLVVELMCERLEISFEEFDRLCNENEIMFYNFAAQ